MATGQMSIPFIIQIVKDTFSYKDVNSGNPLFKPSDLNLFYLQMIQITLSSIRLVSQFVLFLLARQSVQNQADGVCRLLLVRESQ